MEGYPNKDWVQSRKKDVEEMIRIQSEHKKEIEDSISKLEKENLFLRLMMEWQNNEVREDENY